MKVPRVLIIAGSDSGGGAGIQADIKTVTMLGGHAMTAVTAITAQNTLGVSGVHPIPTEMVIAQIDAVLSDIGADAVKIGMIGSAETANAVADRLGTLDVPIVFDPVMVASSGAVLADDETRAAFDRLFALCAVATPNKPELEALSNSPMSTLGDEAIGAVRLMQRTGCSAILAKGGHWGDVVIDPPNQVLDTLYEMTSAVEWREQSWYAPRIDTLHSHGTGCTLASAIATGLGRGKALPAAVVAARAFVRGALLAAPGFGGGHGPMGHWAANDGQMNLNQVTLPALDYAEAVDFYTRLGLTQIVAAPEKGYARFECPGGATLSIHFAAEPVIGDAVLYLEYGELDRWLRAIGNAGIVPDQGPRDESWGWREARLTDPSGNKLCLYQAGDMRRFPPWRLSTNA